MGIITIRIPDVLKKSHNLFLYFYRLSLKGNDIDLIFPHFQILPLLNLSVNQPYKMIGPPSCKNPRRVDPIIQESFLSPHKALKNYPSSLFDQ